MTHPEQQQFFQQLSILFQDYFNDAANILEIGSQDINGSVRYLFDHNANYLGLDLGMAKGVDWTVPGELVELPDGWARVCISTECFEHAESWEKILMNMIRITQENGLLILSIAGPGRATHGTVDSDEGSSPFTISYYRNLGPDDIAEKVKLGHYFKRHSFQVNSEAGDTYFWGIRSANPVNSLDEGWLPPLDRLARAQGQLSQAVNRHNAMKEQVQKSEQALLACKDQLETAQRERQEAQRETVQARQEAADAQARVQALEQAVSDLQNSRIWKLTAPLRKLKDG